MEDKIIKIEEIPHNVGINLKSGKKITAMAKTINTYYESGRKDCKIEIQKPIELLSKSNKLT